LSLDTKLPGSSISSATNNINNAIAREKELKHWTRAQKIALIESMNPTWEELMPYESISTPSPLNADSLQE
jgi:putative endonuclease